MTLLQEDVISSLRRNNIQSVPAQALQLMLRGQCSPAIIFGDHVHYRCVCMSHKEHAIYCVDSFGRGFPGDVVNAFSRLSLRTRVPDGWACVCTQMNSPFSTT